MLEQMSEAMKENGKLREKVKDLEHWRDTSATQQRMLSEDLKAVQDKLVGLPWCDLSSICDVLSNTFRRTILHSYWSLLMVTVHWYILRLLLEKHRANCHSSLTSWLQLVPRAAIELRNNSMPDLKRTSDVVWVRNLTGR